MYMISLIYWKGNSNLCLRTVEKGEGRGFCSYFHIDNSPEVVTLEEKILVPLIHENVKRTYTKIYE